MDTDLSELLEEVKKSIQKASEDDNSLDYTVFHSGRATTYAVLAALSELVEINRRLGAIEEHLRK